MQRIIHDQSYRYRDFQFNRLVKNCSRFVLLSVITNLKFLRFEASPRLTPPHTKGMKYLWIATRIASAALFGSAAAARLLDRLSSFHEGLFEERQSLSPASGLLAEARLIQHLRSGFQSDAMPKVHPCPLLFNSLTDPDDTLANYITSTIQRKTLPFPQHP